MGDIICCRPTDNLIGNATLSLATGSADSDYPLTNLQDGNPAKPAKTTGTSAIIRATFSPAVVLELVSFGPHNLQSATVTLTNNNGFSHVMTVPVNREDGLSVNPFLDLTPLASASTRTASQWNLDISNASAPIAIGDWQLIQTKRTIEILLGAQEAEAHRSIVHQTDYGVKLKYWLGVAQRRIHGTVLLDRDWASYLSLMRSAQGQYKNFLLIMDSDVNDAMVVDLMVDERAVTWITPDSEIGQLDVDFLETQRGVAL